MQHPLLSLWDILVHPSTEGLVVDLLIIALAACGFVLAERRRACILREKGSLDRLAMRTGPAGDQDGEDATATIEDLALRLGLSPTDLSGASSTEVGRRVNDLFHMRDSGAAGLDLVMDLFEQTGDTELIWPRYFTSILVLLGLAGTIWGLHDLLGRLAEATGSSQGYMGLLAALQPLKTAFSCTFYGIVCSVALCWEVSRVDRDQAQYGEAMQRFLSVGVLPLIVPPSDAAQLRQMNEILKRSGRFVKQFGDAVAQSQEVFSDRLSEAMVQASSAFASGLKEAGAGLEKSLSVVVVQVEATIGRMGQSLDAMQSASASLAESARSLQAYRNELAEDRQRIMGMLRETNTSVVSLVDRAVTPMEYAAHQIGEIASTIEALRDGFGEERQDRVNDMRGFVARAEQDHQDTASILQGLERAAAASADAARKVDALISTIRPELLRLPDGEMLGAKLAQVVIDLGRLAGQMQSTTGAIREQTSAFREQAEANQQMVALQQQSLDILVDLDRRFSQTAWRWFVSSNGRRQSRIGEE